MVDSPALVMFPAKISRKPTVGDALNWFLCWVHEALFYSFAGPFEFCSWSKGCAMWSTLVDREDRETTCPGAGSISVLTI